MGGAVEDAVNWAGDRLEDAIKTAEDVSLAPITVTGKIIKGIGDATNIDVLSETGEWVENQADFLNGNVAEQSKHLQQRSDALESQGKALETKAKDTQSNYIMEKFLYKDNPMFSFVSTANDLKYLKYIYPQEAAKLQALADQLNADIKDFEDKYGSGFLGTKDWAGSWLGGIITNIALAIGNVAGFAAGKDISFEDALKSAVALVILVLTIMYAQEYAGKAAGMMSEYGIVTEITYAMFVAIEVVIITISVDSLFGGSQGLIATLDIFGKMFDAIGLTDGNNIFNKFFDSFKKDSDYNRYLIFAVQMTIAANMMPSFDSMLAGNYATAYAGYTTISAVNSAIESHNDYMDKKSEYEQNLVDMQKRAVDDERNARLAKLSVAYKEGNELADMTWFEQFAGRNQWMSFRQNGLFYGIKDSPYDIMFQYDLSTITQPTTRKLGAIYEY